MTDNVHRTNAQTARDAAAATALPNVRDRHLRSAAASDAIATMEERVAASSRLRTSEAAVRRAGAAAENEAE